MTRLCHHSKHRSIGCRRQTESRPHRYVPAPQSHRISECHPRPARARHGCRRRFCRATIRATASTTSPSASFRRRCSSDILSAAQKISRLAIGSPMRSPGGDTILLPPDLTQEDHFDELPFGTRGGTLVHYTFPLDGEYEIQLRLTRDRNEARRRPDRIASGRGDARRRARAVVHREAAAQRQRSQQSRRGSACPDSREGRPARAGRRLSSRSRPLCSKPSASPIRRTSTWIGTRAFSRRSTPSRSLVRSMRRDRRHSPAARRSSSAIRRRPRKRKPAPNALSATLARRAWRRPVTDAELQAPLKFYDEARDRRRLRGRHRNGAARDAGEPAVPVPHRAGSRQPRAAGTAYRVQRSGTGLAAFLLPVEQHSGRRTAWTPPSTASSNSLRCLKSRSGACWPIRAPKRW